MRKFECKARVAALAVVLISAMCAGCGASGQSFQAGLLRLEGGSSKIFVYRLSQFVGGGYTADIVLNGAPMGRLKNGGYISASVPPGRHTIEIDKAFYETGGRYPTSLTTAPGQVYFVRYDQSGGAAGTGTGVVPIVRDGFSVVPQAQAIQELEGLKESN